MLVDEIEIKIKSGKGGNGMATFGPRMGSGPDGGDGGKGGDIIAVASPNLMVLKRYLKNKLYMAQDGRFGGRKQKTGANGEDMELIVPVGSFLEDLDSKEIFKLDRAGDRVLIAKGGMGGWGNYRLRSSTNTTPKEGEPGKPGQERRLRIILRLIADFGLIGLPNAGKSSLLNELTGARARVANYPFTTLEPNLGALENKIIADIPGLIEGAHQGKGLGIRFLKHIERVKLILHCLSAESNDLKADYEIVNQELKKFKPALLRKKQILLLTKTDLFTAEEISKKLAIAGKLNKNIFSVSIHDWDALEKLKKFLLKKN
ncbi:MAG: GTPase ObgE [Patescibacteria group bacterium]